MNRAVFAGRPGGEVGRVEGVAELVGGEDVQAPVADERGRVGHRVEDALHGRADPLLGRPAPAWRRPGWVARARSNRWARSASSSWSALASAFEHAVGDAAGVAALEAGVVLDADPGEHARPLRGAGPVTRRLSRRSAGPA